MSRRERQRRRQRRRVHPVRRVVLMTVLLIFLALGLGVAGVAGWVVHVADSAPDISQLKPRDEGQVSTVYASNGSLLGYITSDTLRAQVAEDKIPQMLKDATVAIEDRRFFQHGGVDFQGILRAGVRDVFDGGHDVQGGSTLTMQLVDNDYLPYQIREHHNLRYKIVQAKLAEQLEDKYKGPTGKEKILTDYLNDVSYGTVGGQTAVGVGAASQMFFNRSVSHLTLPQIALLAGLPQAPSEYNPFLYPQLARNRRHQVLHAMVQSHYITQVQADAADAAPLEVHRNDHFATRNEPYVFDYVKDQLIQKFGLKTVERGGLKVYSTIDLGKQADARTALLNNEGQAGDPAAALVSIAPTNGHILALATNSNYAHTNFDYATQARRQTGSAFKVFALMTLIHDYHGDPDDTYYTSKELDPGWLPGYPTYYVHTSEETYQGTISVTKATTVSDNTVFAQLGQDLGMAKVSAMAHAMGITSPLTNFPSEVLGAVAVSPLDMADAYATIADYGVHHDATAISKVVFPDGSQQNLGKSPSRRVFTPAEAYKAIQVMKTVIQSGTGTSADYGCPAAGKTGTTSSFTDAYFDGFSPQLTTAVWVGYPNATTSMDDVNGLGEGFGGTLAAPIWHDYMAKASNGFCSDFQQPQYSTFSGQPFFGNYSDSGPGSSNNSSGNGNGNGTGNGNGNGTSTSATTQSNPYTNPTLYAHPPQPASHRGTGTTNSGSGSKPPSGFGTGHSNTGGAGVSHH
jgi:penicillin-binding protein 1A